MDWCLGVEAAFLCLNELSIEVGEEVSEQNHSFCSLAEGPERVTHLRSDKRYIAKPTIALLNHRWNNAQQP